MTIEPTTDMELVREVITSDGVWEMASDDFMQKSDFLPKSGPHNMWLLAHKENICGIILVEIESSTAVKIHPYSVNSGHWFYMMKAFLKWYMENASPEQRKVNASTHNDRARESALKLGFKDEGINRSSFMSGGKMVDQYYLGITKEEIKEAIKWPQQSQ